MITSEEVKKFKSSLTSKTASRMPRSTRSARVDLHSSTAQLMASTVQACFLSLFFLRQTNFFMRGIQK